LSLPECLTYPHIRLNWNEFSSNEVFVQRMLKMEIAKYIKRYFALTAETGEISSF